MLCSSTIIPRDLTGNAASCSLPSPSPIVTTSVSSATIERHNRAPQYIERLIKKRLVSLMTANHSHCQLRIICRSCILFIGDKPHEKKKTRIEKGSVPPPLIGSPTSLRLSLHESPGFSRYASNQKSQSSGFTHVLCFIRTRSCNQVYRLLSAT